MILITPSLISVRIHFRCKSTMPNAIESLSYVQEHHPTYQLNNKLHQVCSNRRWKSLACKSGENCGSLNINWFGGDKLRQDSNIMTKLQYCRQDFNKNSSAFACQMSDVQIELRIVYTSEDGISLTASVELSMFLHSCLVLRIFVFRRFSFTITFYQINVQ